MAQAASANVNASCAMRWRPNATKRTNNSTAIWGGADGSTALRAGSGERGVSDQFAKASRSRAKDIRQGIAPQQERAPHLKRHAPTKEWCVWVDGFLGHAGKWRWGRYASEAVARSVMDKLALRRLPNGKPLWTGIELRYRNTTTAVASPSGVASSLTTTKK